MTSVRPETWENDDLEPSRPSIETADKFVPPLGAALTTNLSAMLMNGSPAAGEALKDGMRIPASVLNRVSDNFLVGAVPARAIINPIAGLTLGGLLTLRDMPRGLNIAPEAKIEVLAHNLVMGFLLGTSVSMLVPAAAAALTLFNNPTLTAVSESEWTALALTGALYGLGVKVAYAPKNIFFR